MEREEDEGVRSVQGSAAPSRATTELDRKNKRTSIVVLLDLLQRVLPVSVIEYSSGVSLPVKASGSARGGTSQGTPRLHTDLEQKEANAPLLEPLPQRLVIASHDDDQIHPSLREQVAGVVVEDDTSLRELVIVVPSWKQRLQSVQKLHPIPQGASL
jgi:hypothetical protein